MSLYKTLVERFNWSLKEIDETNLETLIDFLFFRPEADPNIRTVNGKTYHRAKQVPAWL